MTTKYPIPNIIKLGLGKRQGYGLDLSQNEFSKISQDLPHLEYLSLANKIKHNTTSLYLPTRNNENRNDI